MNKTILVAIIIVSIGIGFVGGFFIGTNRGEKQVTQKLEPVLNQVFTKPANDIRNAAGIVKEVTNGVVMIEMNDPDDYIPHADGTENKKIIVGALVDNNTKITIVEVNSETEEKPATIADIKPGDSVGISSAENMRGKERVPVALLQIVR